MTLLPDLETGLHRQLTRYFHGIAWYEGGLALEVAGRLARKEPLAELLDWLDTRAAGVNPQRSEPWLAWDDQNRDKARQIAATIRKHQLLWAEKAAQRARDQHYPPQLYRPRRLVYQPPA